MINEALRYLRKFNDVKLTELAKDLGVSPSYLSEVENGIKKPNIEIIEKYSKRFGVKKSAIMFFAEEVETANSNKKAKDFFRINMIKFMKIVDSFSGTDK